MKFLIIFMLFGCGTISTTKCSNKLGLEKEQCIEKQKMLQRMKLTERVHQRR